MCEGCDVVGVNEVCDFMGGCDVVGGFARVVTLWMCVEMCLCVWGGGRRVKGRF